jgi:FLVCR family MFS transporter 7
MANPLGVLLANLISPQLVLSIDHVVYLNALTFGPAVVTCLLALATVTRSEPAIPPTLSASTKQTSFFSGQCLLS